MANTNLEKLIVEVNETRGILQSAKVFIEGVPDLITAAVAAAVANGATEAELAPLTALATDLENDAVAVASAISAHSGGASTPQPVG